MAKTSRIIRNRKVAKFSTREYTRCERCGRPYSVYRKFGLCRECMRDWLIKVNFLVLRKLVGKNYSRPDEFRSFLLRFIFSYRINSIIFGTVKTVLK